MKDAPSPADPTAWTVRSLKIAPRVSPGRGRGVHALVWLPAGEVLERCCTVELTSDQCDALEGMKPLGDFYFHHPGDAECGLVVLGLTSLVNHSDSPNAEVRFEQDPDLGWFASLTTTAPVAVGAELLHRYHCPPWFAVT